MERRRRIGAYGLCRERDAVLLARAAADSDLPGVWQLPGGGLEHGEHPAAALSRTFAEETGLTVEPLDPLAAVAETRSVPDLAVHWHLDRIVYRVRPTGGVLRDEPAGSTDLARWVGPAALADLPLMPFTAELLGLPVRALPATRVRRSRPPLPPLPPRRGQRFGAYGLVTDPRGRVLLTLIAPNYPGGGHWHLPGGGTDHGEQPVTGLLRELVEEAGQLGRVAELLEVDSAHNPALLGPEGHPVDWHTVRVIYRVAVDVPTEARVTEAAGGSTAQARWFARPELGGLPLTAAASRAIGRYVA
ncbi:NUDIX hydrolase [Plantactinospora sp. KBS50]|uniref:NUDIX hydrolase n=1 Tax=Plantactinospora sp. KBS50 TaxID=2024580 RepID=UPI000BAABE2D|nr:NUDIX domain-containing protein [Plantactinospora sp. KBS50]ASW53623.1 NUDIX hydrolase [Plantactinospora sp. KBS50]